MTGQLVRIALCLLMFSVCLLPIHAQGPGDQGVDEGAMPIIVAPSGWLNLTFEQLGYETKTLNRDGAPRNYRVDLPGNFRVSATGNYLDLVTYHLPEIPDKLSVLKVIMNGRLVSDISLTAENAALNTVRINLPDGLLQPGANWIRVDLDTSATCEDPGAIVDVFIEQTSSVGFGYQQNPYPTDLSLYPFPLVEESLLHIPVILVLPDQPTSNDLTAAATVVAGLGQTSGGGIDLTAVLASEWNPEVGQGGHLLVIGEPGDHALLNSLVLPLPINSTRLGAGQGVLEEIVSPYNPFRLVLVVSGLDDEGISNAAQALNREAHFLGMRGPVAVVTSLRPVTETVDLRTSSMTLASLGYEDRTVYGAAPQEYVFDFALPLSWQLQAQPFFVFKFSHADILDPGASVIDVALNGVPIGSTLLDESNADEGEMIAPLPTRLLRPGRNRLAVGVEMNFPASSRDKCGDLLDQRAWMVISSESEISLLYNTFDLPPDLGLFPYPFAQRTGMDGTLFVLPDQPSPPVFNDLMQLVVLLGSASQTQALSTHVAYASEVDLEMRKNYHLILLGRPTENSLLRAANAYLPQPFVPDSDLPAPLAVDSVAFLPDTERDAGLLQIGDSPWNEGYSLLAITGTTDEGVRLAVQALLKPPSPLEANLAVVESALNSDEPNQVSTYAVDTRPPTAVLGASQATSRNSAPSEGDLMLLAERWWK
jgi:hypothetical protein